MSNGQAAWSAPEFFFRVAETEKQSARSDVPHTKELAVGLGQYKFGVWAEDSAGDRRFIAAKRDQLIAGGGVPKTWGLVLRSRQNNRPVGAQLGAPDVFWAAEEGKQIASRVPKTRRLVAISRQHAPAVGTQRGVALDHGALAQMAEPIGQCFLRFMDVRSFDPLFVVRQGFERQQYAGRIVTCFGFSLGRIDERARL
jgi:hypothetical protein